MAFEVREKYRSCSKRKAALLKFKTFLYAYKYDIRFLAAIYFLTFCVLLPILCKSWPHSMYYRKPDDSVIEDQVKRINDERYKSAKEYFLQTNKRYINKLDRDYLYAIGIITMRREKEGVNDEYGFLIQTAAAIHEQMNDKIAFFICNIDVEPEKHAEVQSLSEYIPVIAKQHKKLTGSVFEDEKQDYQFCLSAASRFNANYTIIMEDDVLVRKDFIKILSSIIYRFFKSDCQESFCKYSEHWLFLKLFYPQKWSGYGKEIKHMLEKCGIFSISVGFFSLVFYLKQKKCLHQFILFLIGLYFVLLTHAIGRQYVNNLRLFNWHLLEVIPAKGCCTQCVLYPKFAIDKIVKHLNTVSCSKENPVDIVLDNFARNISSSTWLLEPNLLQHIGFKSSLTAKKSLENFLS